MTRTIQNYIMAIILAGAMILALGVTLQTAYAEDENSEVDYVADFVIHGMRQTVVCQPGQGISGKRCPDSGWTDIRESAAGGATVEWQYGVMEEADQTG